MTVNDRFLLDTNAAIALGRGDSGIREFVRRSAEIFVPVITVGELYFGAEKSDRPTVNRAYIQQFIQARTVLPCDLQVAREYGRLRAALRRQGTPIPDNDTWLAAIALRHRLTVVTRDKHFRYVPELPAVFW
jgi:tRNA(fMet)-specific endonuclease VapC